MEVNEFYFAVKIFDQRGAAFHPITAVHVLHAVHQFHFGAVDVAADDAVGLMAARHGGERVLVFGDKFHGGLGLKFQIRRQRPITKPQRAAQPVEIQIEIENPVVEMRAEFFQQVIEMRQAIRLMAVDDEIFFTIRRRVHHLASNRHVAEAHAHELLDEFVVVTGNVNDLGLLAAFAKQLLDQHIVIISPEPAELQFPAINEITDEIEVFTVNQAEEIQQLLYSRMFGAKMDIRDPDRATDDGFVKLQIQMGLVFVHRR